MRATKLIVGVIALLVAGLAISGSAAASVGEEEALTRAEYLEIHRAHAPVELGPSSARATLSATAKRRACPQGDRKGKGKRGKCGKRGKGGKRGKRSAKDFSLSVVRLSGRARGGRATLRLRVQNRRKWTATSVRACARVDRKVARIVRAPNRGAVRFKGRSVCWTLRRVKPKHAISLRFGVKLRRGQGLSRFKVAATVVAGNSNPVAQRFKRPKPAPERTRRRARAQASSGACALPSRLGVVFVTDDSGSMEASDPAHLRARAISVGLDQLPDGSLAAATSFSDYSTELFGVSTVDASTRPVLKGAAEELYDVGLTDYVEAFLGARKQLDGMSGADKKAVVFLSDGAPTTETVTPGGAIAATGAPIYTIGLGVSGEPESEAVLAGIAASSGGQFYAAESAGGLQPIFARIISALTCGAESITEKFSLAPGASKTIPFRVDPGDSEFRALASWAEGEVTVTAGRPDATTMSPGSLGAGESFVAMPTYALLGATNPLIGDWGLVVTADADNIDSVEVTINVFEKTLPPPPPPPPAAGRRLDPCMESYPKTRTITSKQFGGRKKVYDRAASLYEVCTGFGAPEALQLTPGMQCALIAAAATFGGPPVSIVANRACDTLAVVDSFNSGDWAGYAAGEACGYFADVFAGAAGIVAAGATSASGPGAAAVGLGTYRAMSAFLKVACGGLFDGGAASLGIKLESDHQSNIALDVTREGKCIAFGERFGLVHWSAVDCPA